MIELTNSQWTMVVLAVAVGVAVQTAYTAYIYTKAGDE